MRTDISDPNRFSSVEFPVRVIVQPRRPCRNGFGRHQFLIAFAALCRQTMEEQDHMKSPILVGVALVAAVGVANAQDLGAGEQSFRKCAPCHAVGEDATNKVGPLLNGLDGRKSGTVEGYSYSDA